MYHKYGDNVKCLRFINNFFKAPHGKIDNIRDNPLGNRGGKYIFFTSRNN